MKTICIHHRIPFSSSMTSMILGASVLAWLFNFSVSVAQFNFGDNNIEGTLMEAPREFARLYDEAEDAAKREAWTEASLAMGILLGVDESSEELGINGQDYFEFKEGTDETVTESLRAKALKFLDQIPEAGNQAVELRYGVAAQQELEKAVAGSDWSAVRSLIQRYPFTQAGRDAMWLLSEELIGRGMPLDAAMLLTDLMQQSRAQRRFGASGGILASACWKAAGMNQRAKESIDWTKKAFPRESVTFGTNKISLEGDTEAIFEKIDLAATMPANRKETDPHWVGGSLARNSDTYSGLPLPIVNWQQLLHESVQHEEGAAKTIKAKVGDRSSTLIPTRVPIVVPPWVIVMTYDLRINAINMRTGKVDWPASFSGIPINMSADRYTGRDGQTLNLPIQDYLARRIWGEATTAQLSSDGEHIFCISELPSIDAADSISLGVHASVSRPLSRRNFNCLQAFSTIQQGKLIWEVGGESGLAEPKLANVLFMGAPIVYQGELLAMGELNGEVFLFSISPSNGRLNWQQQLAANSAGPLANDPTRRNLSSSPTIAGGVAVCSTLSGQIIAIDLTTRTLRWACKYAQNNHATSNSRGANVWGVQQLSDFRPMDMRSSDSAPIITQGCVVHAPCDGEAVYALDLIDGHLLWKKEKSPILYVGAGWDDKVMLVGDQLVECINVKTGKSEWEKPLPLAGIGRVVGRGVRNGNRYHLPMSSQEIIEIDLATGTVTDRMRVESALGNLIATKDQLIIVSPVDITAYAIRDRFRAEIDLEFAQGGNSATALQRRGKLLLGENKISEALETLEKAYRLNPSDHEIQHLLPQVALRAMREDFEKYAPRIAGYEELILSGPEQSLYLISVIDGLTKAGKPLEAMKKLLELTDLSRASYATKWSRNEAIEPENELQVQQDLYVAARMAQIFEASNNQERGTILELLKDRMIVQPKIVDSNEVNRQSEAYRWLPSSSPLRVAIAQAVLRQGDLLLAEQLVEEVTETAKQFHGPDDTLNMTLESLRLGIYNAAQRWTSAAMVANRLGKTMDAVTLDQPNSSSLNPNSDRERLPNIYAPLYEKITRDDLGRFAKGSSEWPQSKPVTKVTEPDRPLQNLSSGPACIVKESIGTAMQGWNVFVQQGSIDLVGPTGQQRLTVPFDNAARGGGSQTSYAYFIDSIVVIELQSELIAIDTLRAAETSVGFNKVSEPVLWRESFSRSGNDDSQFPNQTRTRINTERLPWGVDRVKNRKGFVVGPVSRKGIFVASDNTLKALDPRTGTPRWVRNGVGNLPTIAVDGNRLALLDHVKGQRSVIDIRDGRLISKQPWSDNYDVWTSCGSNILSTYINRKSNNAITFRLWNAFDESTLLERNFTSDTRAEVLGQADDTGKLPGILVAWQANGELFHWNLETGKEVVQEFPLSTSIRSIALERFGDSVLILPYAPSLKVDVLLDEDQERFRKVSGPMFAVNNIDGKPLWKSPILVNDFRFPTTQTRSTPAITLVRPLRFKASGAATPIETGSVAIVDIRNGNLLYENNYLYSARGIDFQTRAQAGLAKLTIQYRGAELQLNWPKDGEETDPKNDKEKLSLPEQIGKIDRNSLQTGTPQELLERLQSTSGSSRAAPADDGLSDPLGK